MNPKLLSWMVKKGELTSGCLTDVNMLGRLTLMFYFRILMRKDPYLSSRQCQTFADKEIISYKVLNNISSFTGQFWA